MELYDTVVLSYSRDLSQLITKLQDDTHGDVDGSISLIVKVLLHQMNIHCQNYQWTIVGTLLWVMKESVNQSEIKPC